MAKIQRFQGNLPAFAEASQANERTVFGTLTTGENSITANINAEYTRGWGTLPSAQNPPREWFNGVAYTMGKVLAYIHQVGIVEYNATQEYHLGSVCTFGLATYRSLVDNNVGNQPDVSTAQWRNVVTEATSELAQVAFTGAYVDLSGRPTLGTAATRNVGTAAANLPDTTQLNTRLGTTGNLGTMATRNTGTAGAEHRTNTQNDSRFLQSANFGTSWTASYNAATTSFGRSLGSAADEAAGRNVLGLGSMATRFTGSNTSQHQTNGENRAEFAQLNRANWGNTGLGGLGYGGGGSSVGVNYSAAGNIPVGFYSGNNEASLILAREFNNNFSLRFKRIGGNNTVTAFIVLQNSGVWEPEIELWQKENLPDPARLGVAQNWEAQQTLNQTGASDAPVIRRSNSNSSSATINYRGSTVSYGFAGFTPTNYIVTDSTGGVIRFEVNTTNGDARVYRNLQVDGNIDAGGYIRPSDRTLKKSIKPAKLHSLEEVKKALPLVEWLWRENKHVRENLRGTADSGTIAQEVQKLYPNCVAESANGKLGVDEGKLALHLVLTLLHQLED